MVFGTVTECGNVDHQERLRVHGLRAGRGSRWLRGWRGQRAAGGETAKGVRQG